MTLQTQEQDDRSTKVFQTIFQDKPVKMILKIYEKQRKQLGKTKPPYIAELRKEIGSTGSHTKRVSDRLERLGIINREKDGTRKRLTLTPYGQKIAEDLKQAEQHIGETQ